MRGESLQPKDMSDPLGMDVRRSEVQTRRPGDKGNPTYLGGGGLKREA